MVQSIKKLLLENPESLVKLLEHFGFSNIVIFQNEIRFGRDEISNRTAIRISLKNNDSLFVNDFSRANNCDLFQFIIQNKNSDFKIVFETAKSILNISDLKIISPKKEVFVGFYNKIKSKNENSSYEIYDERILENYINAPNLRFLKDNISLYAQKLFEIKYDIETQRIIIPIRSPTGDLLGIKSRANWEVSENENKYFYLLPCSRRKTLYGYFQNKEFLKYSNFFVFEAEKSVMQAFSYGFKNCVALGGNLISDFQCKLILELCPEAIIFLFDEGLDFEILKINMLKLSKFLRLTDTKIGYWDYKIDKNIPEKVSPTDLGKEKFKEILEKQIKWW